MKSLSKGHDILLRPCNTSSSTQLFPIDIHPSQWRSCGDAYEYTWMYDESNYLTNLSEINKLKLAKSVGFCPQNRCQLDNVDHAKVLGRCPEGLCYTKVENGSLSFGACCFNEDGAFKSGWLLGYYKKTQPIPKPLYKESRIVLGSNIYADSYDSFIHANHVYNGLILTQCPLKSTVKDAMQMVLEKNVTLWIQLAEKGSKKSTCVSMLDAAHDLNYHPSNHRLQDNVSDYNTTISKAYQIHINRPEVKLSSESTSICFKNKPQYDIQNFTLSIPWINSKYFHIQNYFEKHQSLWTYVHSQYISHTTLSILNQVPNEIFNQLCEFIFEYMHNHILPHDELMIANLTNLSHHWLHDLEHPFLTTSLQNITVQKQIFITSILELFKIKTVDQIMKDTLIPFLYKVDCEMVSIISSVQMPFNTYQNVMEMKTDLPHLFNSIEKNVLHLLTQLNSLLLFKPLLTRTHECNQGSCSSDVSSIDTEFIWYYVWPDFHIPKNPFDQNKLLEIAWKAVSTLLRNETVVVSCYSGRGRSGTFAALVIGLLKSIQSHSELVDIIVRLREKRDGLVETPLQYHFIANLLRLSNSLLLKNTK